ncbi:hypothetical protein N7536_001198 [Penicillium majusculum]|nr:hypothetical protein N7536_001198 [Penicillium majusculum]
MALLSLPNEILLAIADHLRSLNDINAFAQTNHRCYAVFSRQLYVYASIKADKPGFLWANFLDVGAITGLDPANTIQTPLDIAARRGSPEVVTLLIKYRAKVYDNMKLYCQAALAEAIRCGRVDVVRVLLDKEVDLEYVYEDDRRPLHIAAQTNIGEMIKFLFACGVNIYHFNQRKTFALHIAAMKGKERAVQALLECGFNPNFVDADGDAPIHCAARVYRDRSTVSPEDKWTVIDTLLKHGADPYLKNRHGFMPLWIAAFLNCGVIIGGLLGYGVNPHGLDANGNAQEPMPLEEFREMVHEKLADISSHFPQVGHESSLNCCTPLCIAAFLGCENAVKLLLDHGANPNSMDPNGEMPLHLAVRDKNCPIAELLIKEGACLGSWDCHDRTPLDWALSSGGHEMIELLHNKGASIGSIDWRGEAAPLLSHIVDWADDYTFRHQSGWPYGRYPGDWDGGESHDYENVVEWFLEGGSKVDSRDSLGRTVLHQAAFQNCE